jgi:hypothetical protein
MGPRRGGQRVVGESLQLTLQAIANWFRPRSFA